MSTLVTTVTGYVNGKVKFKSEFRQTITELPIPPLGFSLPSFSLPKIPEIGPLPTLDSPPGIKVNLPQLPTLPSLSLPIPPLGLSLPSISLPKIPELPKLPTLDSPPGIKVNLPKLPSLPSLSLGAIPALALPSFSFPSLPQLPGIPIPDLPSFGATTIKVETRTE